MKSIASRMLASRNSIFGMIVQLIGDARSSTGILGKRVHDRSNVCPYWRIGSSSLLHLPQLPERVSL
jgi:hypothetical protein